jgi:PHD/YefM family antitoxin component YafN of YafNO toxin-antitoxin module
VEFAVNFTKVVMIQVQNIRSLSEFQRNAKTHIRRLKKTGEPEVLTVNGQAEVVVQDANAYQKLLDELDRKQAIEGISRGLAQAKRGEGVLLADFDKRMRRKYKIRRDA